MDNKRRTVDPELKMRTLMALTEHVGLNNAIGMGELYESVTGGTWRNRINDTRTIRQIITQLRYQGQRICSSPARAGGGYYLASAASELGDYLRKNKTRALKLLQMNATIERISLPELLGQIRLQLEEADHENATG